MAVTPVISRRGPSKAAKLDTLIEGITTPFLDVFAVSGPSTTSSQTVPSSADLQAVVAEVREKFQELTEDGGEQELRVAWGDLTTHGNQFHDVGVAWIRLIEALVWNAEARHPGEKQGDLKAKEVKWVVAYLLQQNTVQIPGLPSFLRPLAVDVFADVTVNAVVAVLNDYNLLAGRPKAPRPAVVAGGIRWRLFQIARWLTKPFGRLNTIVGNGLSRIYIALRWHPMISPTLRSALAAVEEEDQMAKEAGLFDEVAALGSWLKTHRDVVVVVSQLIGILIKQAETLTHLNGPQKKAYAENLLLAVLQDMGIGQGIFGSAIVRGAISFGMDAFVDILKRRDPFRLALSAQGTPGK